MENDIKAPMAKVAPQTIREHHYSELITNWWQAVNTRRGIVTITICGKRGSGKSWAMLYLGWLLDRDYKDNPRFSVDKVSFKASEFLEWLTKPKKEWRRGNVICLDDAGLHMYNRDSLTNFIKSINKTLQNVRYKHPIIILTLPSFGMLDKHARDMSDVYIEMVSRDEADRVNFCKIQELRLLPFTDKLMRKNIQKKSVTMHPYLNIPIIRREPVLYQIPAPSDELVDAYEEKKAEYLDAYNIQTVAFLKKEENRLKDAGRDKRQKMNFPDAVKYCRNRLDQYLEDGKINVARIMLEEDDDGKQLFGKEQAGLICRVLKSEVGKKKS